MWKGIVFGLLTIFVCQLVNAQVSRLYSNKDFSIKYPENWTYDTTKIAGSVMFLSPLDSARDKFDENLGVQKQDLQGKKMDLKAYKALSESQLAALEEDGTMIQSEIETDSVGEKYKSEFLMTMNSCKLHIKSLARIRNGFAYLITLTTTESSYDRFSALGDQ